MERRKQLSTLKVEKEVKLNPVEEQKGIDLSYGASNTLVSKERYEELRKQMRSKLNNLNI